METTKIMAPMSAAELIDKIAILEVKKSHIADPDKLKNVNHELDSMMEIFNKYITPSPELDALFNKLRILSAKGWDIEDGKRACEHVGDFGEKFVEFARGAFKNNDERSTVWKEINLLLKSDIIQEKSYEEY